MWSTLLEVESANDCDEHEGMEIEGEQSTPATTLQEEQRVSRSAAMLVLKLKQKHKLSQSALDAVTEEFTSFLQSKLEEIQNIVLRTCTADSGSLSVVQSVLQYPTITDPFYGLHGKCQQEKYFSLILGLQVFQSYFTHAMHVNL